jgi:hypothetical protein
MILFLHLTHNVAGLALPGGFGPVTVQARGWESFFSLRK